MMAALLLAACLASYAGFACMALAMQDHWSDLAGRPGRPPARRLRGAGLCLLGVAYLACVWRDGASFGSLLWLVLVSAAALAVAFTVTWRMSRR